MVNRGTNMNQKETQHNAKACREREHEIMERLQEILDDTRGLRELLVTWDDGVEL